MIEVSFDEVKVGVGGAAEIFQLSAFELKILTGAEFFVNTGGADFVADGELLRMTGGVGPRFVPDPDVVFIVEEFAAVTGGNGAEKGAAVAGLGVDEFVAAGVNGESGGGQGVRSVGLAGRMRAAGKNGGEMWAGEVG